MSAEPTAATPVPPIQSRGEFQQAIRDAFDAAARQIEDHARLQRGEVKRHDARI